MIKLYQFPHSHFSEKARWALDFKGFSFERVNLMRGMHYKRLRALGVPDSTVPVLQTDEVILQGSGAILSYLDELRPEPPLLPADPVTAEAVLAFEARMDDELGHGTRRYIYSVLLHHPKIVRRAFFKGRPWFQQLLFPVLFGSIKRRIRASLDIGPTTRAEMEQQLGALIFELTAQLGDKPFLFGQRLTRADITVASFLALLCWPPEHEFDWPDPSTLPAEMLAFLTRPEHRRLADWVRGLYAEHRVTSAA